MTQPDTVYHLVAIDGHTFMVSEKQAKLLAFLAQHVIIRQVLDIDGIESYQVVIDCRGRSQTATVRVG